MKLAVVIDSPSNSAKTLAESLEVRRIRSNRIPTFRGRRLFINWGNRFAVPNNVRVLNDPRAVAVAANKLSAWNAIGVATAGIPIPQYTTEQRVAQDWTARSKVLARSTATGSGGDGITVVDRGGTVPRAMFYVRYIPKSAEYRFHVVNNEVIFRQQKRMKNGTNPTREQRLIRNHDNGWVFAENNVTFASTAVERRLEEVALNAVTRLQLDFAAVDLIVERETNNVFFLEANCRPGLESTRLIAAYTAAFETIADEQE